MPVDGDRIEVAIQYLRRSSDKQEDSTEQQRAINDAYIAREGYALPPDGQQAVWEETGSGRTFDDRPVFQAMLRAAESGAVRADLLVMYRPNRLGRSQDITEFHYYEHRFRKAGIRIEYALGSEYNLPGLAGHITRSVAYAQAGEYSKNLSVDATRGLLANARNGYSTGGEPCYGYDRMLVDLDGNQLGLMPRGSQKGKDRTKKVVYVLGPPDLVEFIRRNVFERPFEMAWGAAKTARELNKMLRDGRGLPPARAGRTINRKDGTIVRYSGTWKAATIYDMWTRPTYIGWREVVIEADNDFHGERVVCKGAHEPLVSEEVFWGLYERTKARPWNTRKLGPPRRRRPGRYPLSGLGRCIHCGSGFSGSRTSNKTKGHVQYYYRDSGETNRSCGAPRWSIPVATFDPWVRERIIDRLRSGHFQESLLRLLRERLHPGEGADPTETARAKLTEVEKAIENLLNIATHSTSGSAALATRLDMLEAQRAKLTEEIVANQPGKGPRVRDEDILRVADEVTRQAEVLLEADGELLAELAPRFIKEFLVDKEKRVVEAYFYEIPGLRLSVPRSRIDMVEAAGVEPASEMADPERLRA